MSYKLTVSDMLDALPGEEILVDMVCSTLALVKTQVNNPVIASLLTESITRIAYRAFQAGKAVNAPFNPRLMRN